MTWDTIENIEWRTGNEWTEPMDANMACIEKSPFPDRNDVGKPNYRLTAIRGEPIPSVGLLPHSQTNQN
jgi:hypothetical protein